MSDNKLARVLAPIDTLNGRIDINQVVNASEEMITEWKANELVDDDIEAVAFCINELGAIPILV